MEVDKSNNLVYNVSMLNEKKTLKVNEMKNKIESALIIGTSLVAIGALALWGAWLMASMAISS